jgi:hypothetical protein
MQLRTQTRMFHDACGLLTLGDDHPVRVVRPIGALLRGGLGFWMGCCVCVSCASINDAAAAAAAAAANNGAAAAVSDALCLYAREAACVPQTNFDRNFTSIPFYNNHQLILTGRGAMTFLGGQHERLLLRFYNDMIYRGISIAYKSIHCARSRSR